MGKATPPHLPAKGQHPPVMPPLPVPLDPTKDYFYSTITVHGGPYDGFVKGPAVVVMPTGQVPETGTFPGPDGSTLDYASVRADPGA